jgi:hypothetical protein
MSQDWKKCVRHQFDVKKEGGTKNRSQFNESVFAVIYG